MKSIEYIEALKKIYGLSIGIDDLITKIIIDVLPIEHIEDLDSKYPRY